MNEKHYKCVVLIIASESTAFDSFKQIWIDHWAKSFKYVGQLRCFYLYNDPSLSNMNRKGDDLYFPYEETYPSPGLLSKTMDSLKFLADQNISYDFILRTNLSSLFNWKAFAQFIDNNISKSKLVAGVPYNTSKMSGMCMILSRDLVQIIIEKKTQLDFNLPDDEAINRVLNEIQNVTYVELASRGIDSLDQDLSKLQDIIHYRFHSGWIEGNLQREKDHSDMRKMQTDYLTVIVEHFYTSMRNDPLQASISCMLIIVALIFIRGNTKNCLQA
jgi:hypothetical protein